MRRRVYTGQAKCKESTSKLGHVYQGRFALLVSVINIYGIIMYVTVGCLNKKKIPNYHYLDLCFYMQFL